MILVCHLQNCGLRAEGIPLHVGPSYLTISTLMFFYRFIVSWERERWIMSRIKPAEIKSYLLSAIADKRYDFIYGLYN